MIIMILKIIITVIIMIINDDRKWYWFHGNVNNIKGE